MGMSVYELPPGQAIGPYHFEWTDEEWLIVLAGRPTLRTPEGERTLDPGDTVCFPAGPDGAHHTRNDTDELVRVALLSTKNEFGIAEYPDSDKVGVWAGGELVDERPGDHGLAVPAEREPDQRRQRRIVEAGVGGIPRRRHLGDPGRCRRRRLRARLGRQAECGRHEDGRDHLAGERRDA